MAGSTESARGFTGEWYDRDAELLYLLARWYAPATGRFLTPSRNFNPYDPRTLNRYAPLQDPTLWLLAPLGLVAVLLGKKRRKVGYWLLLLLAVGLGASVVLSGCGPVTPTPTPQPPSPPTQPPTQPPPTEPPPTQPPPTPTPSGKTAYLTFDDGPEPYITPQIARELQARGVVATFFLTGADPSDSEDPNCSDAWLRIYSPDYSLGENSANALAVSVIQSTGHAIGVHGWRHDHPWYAFNLAEEVRMTEEALKDILGDSFSAALLRAPGGDFPAEETSGYASLMSAYANSYYYGWDIPSEIYDLIDPIYGFTSELC